MDKKNINQVLLAILLLSIANFSSISALKNTKLGTIQLRPNANLDFTHFLELENNSMANSLYSLIQTGINTGKNINEIMEAILNIKNQLEKDFRSNQQIYRNKKLNINNILHEKNLSLKLMKEKLLNYENEKQMLKKIFENFNKKRNSINENLSFINSKISSEADFFGSNASIFDFYLRRNSFLITFAKYIHKVLLEDNRIPDIKLSLEFEFLDNKDKNVISNVKAIYKSNEISENLFNNVISNPIESLDNFNNKIINKKILNNFEKGFLIEEVFLIFEHILNISCDKIPENSNFNLATKITVKERILNILNALINVKEKENLNFTEKLKANEENKTKLLKKYNKLKEFYLTKLTYISNQTKSNSLSEMNFEEKIKFIQQEENLAKNSIGSLAEEIKFYTETNIKDEKQYTELVERTKFLVKAINQIKKHMINNFENLKDYILSRKI